MSNQPTRPQVKLLTVLDRCTDIRGVFPAPCTRTAGALVAAGRALRFIDEAGRITLRITLKGRNDLQAHRKLTARREAAKVKAAAREEARAAIEAADAAYDISRTV